MKRFFQLRHALPVLALLTLCFLFWSRLFVGDTVLLPGEFLRGFAPYGAEPRAPWNILQWDAMGQYLPWRTFAGREISTGHIPLWNPHQFAGTPLMANAQSAVFYPLNIFFWLGDVPRAFTLSALAHTILATLGTYYLAQHWRLSLFASLTAAVAFGFCGYLTFWVTLPTLSNTASWIPLLVLLFERTIGLDYTDDADEPHPPLRSAVFLTVALACGLLAGHPQIFFYCILALLLRALTFPFALWKKAFPVWAVCLTGALLLCSIQLLPTLELARIGHRAGESASATGWQFVSGNALPWSELTTLFLPFQPQLSFSENKGYVGIMALLLAVLGVMLQFAQRRTTCDVHLQRSAFWFAVVLTVFGLFYALATPLAQAFYFGVPGLSQMGGVGRVLVLWSLGIALLAAFGVHKLQQRVSGFLLAPLACVLVTLELFAVNSGMQPSAPREIIYPPTSIVLSDLQKATQDGSRVLFVTPRRGWLPSELLSSNSSRTHPPGVLPPNGATMFRLNDVNGYDSLSSGAYRQFLIEGEKANVSPQLNGNMVLVENLDSPALDALNVRYVVTQEELSRPDLREVRRDGGCIVYERRVRDVPRKSGADFVPGWRDGVYQPQSFRLGAFLSLCGLLLLSLLFGASFGARLAKEPRYQS